jgi:hypothetical protein
VSHTRRDRRYGSTYVISGHSRKKITAAAERRLDLADRLAAVMLRSDFHPIT